MRTFEYKGFDAAGRTCRGLVEALDVKEAREKLAAQGLYPERIDSAGGERAFRGARREAGFDLAARAMVYRELGTLLRAGLPLARALQVLIDAPELGDARRYLAAMRDRIQEGASMAASLRGAAPGVSAFETAVVEAGERAGALGIVLERLAVFMEEQERIRDRVINALIYPAIVVAAALIIGAVTLGILVPRIGGMLDSANLPLPAVTKGVLAVARAFPALGLILMLAIAGAALALRARAEWRDELRRRIAGWLNRAPLTAAIRGTLLRLRFTRTLAMLIRGGVGMVEAVKLAGEATGNAEAAEAAALASDAVKHGKSLADALRVSPQLGESLPGWVQAGEASGKLEELLESAADRYQQQWERRVTRLLTVVEPVLILLVSAFVLVIALAILMPVMNLNQALQ